MNKQKDPVEFLSGQIEALETLLYIVHWEVILKLMDSDEIDELTMMFEEQYQDTPLMPERQKGWNQVFRNLGHRLREKQESKRTEDAVSV